VKTIQGPAIFLAQFVRDEPPFNSLEGLCKWAAGHGYKGIQIPTWESWLVDVHKAASSKDYCDELLGTVRRHGLEITELATHLQGQLLAVHPAYDALMDTFAPTEVHGKAKARTEWATTHMIATAKACQNLGLGQNVTFSGTLLWPYFFPWPQRPAGLVEEGFAEMARRWKPILDVHEEYGVDICFELHPVMDLHDGVTFERFVEATDNHPRACINYDPSHFILQQMDYLAFIDHYHERITAFHVKDAEYNANGKAGVYGSYAGWVDRPGRFRSTGDGQVDFPSVFSKLSQYGFGRWAVIEWECCIKDSEQGAREGAEYINQYIINVTERAFDDFAGGESDRNSNRKLLGLD
jgi:sugar phosphate isomerase/epimerase